MGKTNMSTIMNVEQLEPDGIRHIGSHGDVDKKNAGRHPTTAIARIANGLCIISNNSRVGHVDTTQIELTIQVLQPVCHI